MSVLFSSLFFFNSLSYFERKNDASVEVNQLEINESWPIALIFNIHVLLKSVFQVLSLVGSSLLSTALVLGHQQEAKLQATRF